MKCMMCGEEIKVKPRGYTDEDYPLCEDCYEQLWLEETIAKVLY